MTAQQRDAHALESIRNLEKRNRVLTETVEALIRAGKLLYDSEAYKIEEDRTAGRVWTTAWANAQLVVGQ